MNYYLDFWKKYFDFKTKTTRKGFWMFILLNFIVILILTVAEGALGLQLQGSGYGILSGVYALATIIPGLAIGVRRLHDIGKSGWWILIGLIPVIGWIVLFVFYVMPSKGAGDKPAAPAAPAPPAAPAA